MRTIWIVAGLIGVWVLWFPASSAEAGDPSRGLEISTACQACHGRDGNMALEDDYPRLGGQYADYLVHALRSYRDGTRQHEVMSPFAQDLSDRDIRDLAAWYASQDGLVPLRIR